MTHDLHTLKIKVWMPVFYFLLVISLFPQESEPFAIADIFGTFEFVSYDDHWEDNHKTKIVSGNNPESLKFINNSPLTTLVIDEDGYYFGSAEVRYDTSYSIFQKGKEALVWGLNYNCSESLDYFPQYPRKYDWVIGCSGRIWAIEVIDRDTIIISKEGYMLFKRVK